MISLLRGILNKMIQVNLFTQQKQTHRLRERTYGYGGEGWGGRIDWEVGYDIHTPLYLKQITGTYCIATGNSA